MSYRIGYHIYVITNFGERYGHTIIPHGGSVLLRLPVGSYDQIVQVYFHSMAPDSKTLVVRNGVGFPKELIGELGEMEEIFDSIKVLRKLEQ